MKENDSNKHKTKQTEMNAFFQYLNKAGVGYVLISNYYYKHQKGGDIDLYVPVQNKDIFLTAINELGFQHRRKPPILPNHNFYFRFVDSFFILLDVKYELSFYFQDGYVWLYNRPERVISKRCMINDSYRPSGFDALMLYAAHCCSLEKSRLEQRHVQNFKNYITNFCHEVKNPEQIKVLKSLELCLQKTDLQYLTQELSRIIRPFFLIKKRFTGWHNLKCHLLFGSGFRVLFLGTDGTGKTTLVKALRKVLPFNNRTLYLGMGEEGWLLSWIQKYQKFCQKTLWAHRFRLGLLFSWVLLPLELLIRRLKLSLNSRYSVVLIDRFPGFPFLQGGLIGWLYRCFLPRPDLVVLLSGNPESIAKRKPNEITPERIEKELIKWATVAERVGATQVLKLDTICEDVQKCLEKILMAIRNHSMFKQKMFKSIKVVTKTKEFIE